MDEGFALDPIAGELLMGAIGPAQITVLDKQIWIVSTAGTAESTWFHDWIDRAMEGTPRVAGFVWGAREDQDPYKLEDIAAFHPGVGFELNGRTLEASDVLEQASRNSRAEYERAYANRRTSTMAQLIPTDVWRARAATFGPPDTTQCVLAFDVAHDRQSSAIVAAWKAGDVVRVKVVRAGPGLRWVAGALTELRDQWRPIDVVAAGNGNNNEVIADLRHLTILTEREYATATGGLLTAIEDESIEHDDDPVLTSSVTGLVTRPAAGGDGVAFVRRLSAGDSAPGIAAAMAAQAARTRHAQTPIAIPFGG